MIQKKRQAGPSEVLSRPPEAHKFGVKRLLINLDDTKEKATSAMDCFSSNSEMHQILPVKKEAKSPSTRFVYKGRNEAGMYDGPANILE